MVRRGGRVVRRSPLLCPAGSCRTVGCGRGERGHRCVNHLAERPGSGLPAERGRTCVDGRPRGCPGRAPRRDRGHRRCPVRPRLQQKLHKIDPSTGKLVWTAIVGPDVIDGRLMTDGHSLVLVGEQQRERGPAVAGSSAGTGSGPTTTEGQCRDRAGAAGPRWSQRSFRQCSPRATQAPQRPGGPGAPRSRRAARSGGPRL